MLLTELFKSDQKMEYTLEKKTASRWVASMILNNGHKLRVVAEMVEALGIGGEYVWDIAFEVDDRTDKTGEGNEIEVFKKVVYLLGEFKSAKKPTFINMTAAEDNRANLYVKLLKRGLPGWKVVRYDHWDRTIAAIIDDEFPVIKHGDLQAAIILGSTGITFYDGEPEGSITPDSAANELAPEIEKAIELSRQQ